MQKVFAPKSIKSWGALQGGPAGPWPSQNFGWVGHNAFGPTNNWPVCSLILHRGLFKRPTSKGMEGNGRGGRKGKGEGSGEMDGGIWPTQKFWGGAPYESNHMSTIIDNNDKTSIQETAISWKANAVPLHPEMNYFLLLYYCPSAA